MDGARGTICIDRYDGYSEAACVCVWRSEFVRIRCSRAFRSIYDSIVRRRYLACHKDPLSYLGCLGCLPLAINRHCTVLQLPVYRTVNVGANGLHLTSLRVMACRSARGCSVRPYRRARVHWHLEALGIVWKHVDGTIVVW